MQIFIEEWQTRLPLLKSESVDLIIIDPPYITTKEKWDQIEQVNPKLSQELFRIAKPNCSIYIWCGIGEKSNSLMRWFPIFDKDWHFKDLITWKKQRGMGMRKGWLYTREEAMWFVKDNKNFRWNKSEQYSRVERPFHITKNGKPVNKSKFKRFTNVWGDIMEVGFGKSPQKFKEIRSTLPYTPKPYNVIERIIKAHTNENSTVLDCFAGSGITGKVCLDLGLKCILIEPNVEYLSYGLDEYV